MFDEGTHTNLPDCVCQMFVEGTHTNLLVVYLSGCLRRGLILILLLVSVCHDVGGGNSH